MKLVKKHMQFDWWEKRFCRRSSNRMTDFLPKLSYPKFTAFRSHFPCLLKRYILVGAGEGSSIQQGFFSVSRPQLQIDADWEENAGIGSEWLDLNDGSNSGTTWLKEACFSLFSFARLVLMYFSSLMAKKIKKNPQAPHWLTIRV